jgi:hypothetical protein
MTELAVRHVEDNCIVDLRPIGIAWEKNKLRVRVDKVLDQSGRGHAVHFNFLSSDPFHMLANTRRRWRF